MESGMLRLTEETWLRAYTQYHRLWITIALGMRLSVDEAEDVLHGVLASLLNNPSREFTSMDHLKNYISRAVINRSIQSSNRRERFSPLNEREESHDSHEIEQVEEAIRSSMLHALIKRLPEADAAILQLRYFDGLTFVQMSKKLGTPISTLKSREDAAIGRIRKIIGKSVV